MLAHHCSNGKQLTLDMKNSYGMIVINRIKKMDALSQMNILAVHQIDKIKIAKLVSTKFQIKSSSMHNMLINTFKN